MLKVLVTGDQGYTGWPTVIKLLRQGHKVIGVDDNFRERIVYTIGSRSAFKIESEKDREKYGNSILKNGYRHIRGDISGDYVIQEVIKDHKPDYIIHLAAQPSAPYSMIDKSVAKFTQRVNNDSTMNILWAMKEYVPKSTLIYSSTMGIYGQPKISIPWDGMFKANYQDLYGEVDTWHTSYMNFPTQAGSFYHLSKVLDEQNIQFASKQWNLRTVVFRQGVVIGNHTSDPMLEKHHTRFDFDRYFGTAFNRFVAQAVLGMGMTLYGKGQQTRAFATLEHTVEDLVHFVNHETASLEGKPIIRNTVTECMNLTRLTETIKQVVEEDFGINCQLKHVDNPRKENEENDLVMEQEPRSFDLRQEINKLSYSLLNEGLDTLKKYRNHLE